MAAGQDPRKTFVVETIAGAIAPVADQKVSTGPCSFLSRWRQHNPTRCCCLCQAAYAEYLGRDDSGAISAFLDDATTNLLQVNSAHVTAGRQSNCGSRLHTARMRVGSLASNVA